MDYIEFIKNNTTKVCTNVYFTTNEPWRYRNPELYTFATKAFKEGRDRFYIENIDENEYSRLRECEPKYKYILNYEMTEDEYKELIGER